MGSDADGGAGMFHELAAGDRRALGRAITLVEGGAAGAREAALALEWPDRTRVIALTGPPGVGKSELANRLAAYFADAGLRVAVLAVDPSSPRTGGALLGDRVRFTGDSSAVFFRSMAARAGERGLAPEVPAVLRLLAAGGAERILLETAGVGQGDDSVLRLADLGIAVTAVGLGDAVQAAKAGLFEVADFVVVNQADRPGAEAMAASFRALRSGPVFLTSAIEGTGVEELRAAAEVELEARHPLDRSAVADADGSRAGTPGPAIRLHHVGIAMKDGSRGAELWRALLGLRETGRYRVDEFGVLALFLAPEGERAPAGGFLELLEPTSGDSPVAGYLDRRGEGLHHVCFEVADIHATLRALEARGVRLVDREPRRGAGGHLVAFIHPASAGGVLLELKQA
ncbi:MAG: methylmalonyl-CoA epimerase [Acidobacteria bacterium]|nr:methylmalonyl-CoA epimerase [Acidobacteriota bacterium]MYH20647.1 methylmalonyl-CoA epimerase [Acidobacteriota bacterium]MYK78798.1 methylmalonyl-CoA epimerase [Acidobacteriota bacterium]